MDLDTFFHPCIHPDHVSFSKIDFIHADRSIKCGGQINKLSARDLLISGLKECSFCRFTRSQGPDSRYLHRMLVPFQT